MIELKIDTEGLTAKQVEIAEELKTVLTHRSMQKIEIWNESKINAEMWGAAESEKPEMGVQITDDGMAMTGYFNTEGELVGDWA